MSIWSRLGSFLRGGSTLPVPVRRRGKNPTQLSDMLEIAASEIKAAPRDLLAWSYHNRPLWPEFNSQEGLDAFESWTYVCVHKTAMALASIPWTVRTRDPETGAWTWQPDHLLSQLLADPNPFWSGHDLTYRIISELMLTGNSVICIARAGVGDRQVAGNLWTVRPQRIAPVPSKDIHLAGFEILGMDGRRHFRGIEDCVHVQFPNPENPYWGKAPAEAGHVAHKSDTKAALWQASAIDNTMVPPGLFTFREGLGQKQFDDAKAILAEQYQGAINARRPMLLGEDAKWQSMSQTAVDMDWREGRRLTREEICAIYGVPQMIAGILTDATYSNFGIARESWWQDTLAPLGDFVAAALTARLVPEFGGDPRNMQIMPDARHTPALQSVAAGQEERVSRLVAIGVPFNTASAHVGLDLQIPGGDIGYVPASWMPTTTEGAFDPDDLTEGLPGTVLDDADATDGKAALLHRIAETKRRQLK